MSEVELFGLPPSANVRTAMMVLANKGVAYNFCPVNFREESYKKHHPFAKIPSLLHRDVELFENLAIAVYVDEGFDGPALQPKSPLQKAIMFQWMSATQDYLYRSLVATCIYERFIKPMRGMEPDMQVIETGKLAIAEHLDILDARLASVDYLAGDKLTLADIFLAPVMFYFANTPEGDEMLPARPALSDWHGRMQQTPDYNQINTLLKPS